MGIYQFDVQNVKGAPFDVTYVFDAVDFGAGDSEELISGPTDRRGTVRQVAITDVSEVFNQDTTPARVDVGVGGGDADAYAVGTTLGTLAVGANLYPVFSPGVARNTIPANSSVGVNCIAPTGGIPTGIAKVSVTITWY